MARLVYKGKIIPMCFWTVWDLQESHWRNVTAFSIKEFQKACSQGL